MRASLVWGLVLLVVVAGCTTGTVSLAPTQTLMAFTPSPVQPTSTPTVPPALPGPADLAVTPEGTVSSAQAQALVGLVVNDLAAVVGVAPADIQLHALEHVVWPDGDLGCAAGESGGGVDQSGELEGYRIELAHDGNVYEYHTDALRAFVLCAADNTTLIEGEPVLLDPVVNSLVDLARRNLADSLDLPQRRVFLEEIQPVEWPDSSLGCPQPDQEYPARTVLGYRIVLRVGPQAYYFHTDYRQVILCPEAQVVLPGPSPTPEPATATPSPET